MKAALGAAAHWALRSPCHRCLPLGRRSSDERMRWSGLRHPVPAVSRWFAARLRLNIQLRRFMLVVVECAETGGGGGGR